MNALTHKTKIVATIGPSSQTPEIIGSMIRAGMTIAASNFSHDEFSGRRQIMKNIRTASSHRRGRVAIMAHPFSSNMRIGPRGEFSVDKVHAN